MRHSCAEHCVRAYVSDISYDGNKNVEQGRALLPPRNSPSRVSAFVLTPHFLSEGSWLISCLSHHLFQASVFWNLSLTHLHSHRIPPSSRAPLLYPSSTLRLSPGYHITPCIAYHLFLYYFPNYSADSWKVRTASYSFSLLTRMPVIK